VLNWMNVLGYKYDRIMKHYFNDKHKDNKCLVSQQLHQALLWI
jgi:hypothetical protein